MKQFDTFKFVCKQNIKIESQNRKIQRVKFVSTLFTYVGHKIKTYSQQIFDNDYLISFVIKHSVLKFNYSTKLWTANIQVNVRMKHVKEVKKRMTVQNLFKNCNRRFDSKDF